MSATSAFTQLSKPGQRRLTLVCLSLVVGLSLTMASAMRPATAHAADLSVQAQADTTARRLSETTNYGTAPTFSARRFGSQAFVRFDLTEWLGRPIEKLELGLSVLTGDASSLRIVRTDAGWDELTLTWAARPSVEPAPMVEVTSVGDGTITVDVAPFFPEGTVDRDVLSLRLRSATTTEVRMASRETQSGPVLTFTEKTTTSVAARPSAGAMRFYTPNIIAQGDTSTPARDTERAQMEALFANEADMARVLDNVDVYSFFGASLGRGDPTYDAMVRRAIPMLDAHGVDLGLEVGGPLGYAPPVVYGGDVAGKNGEKSALFDLSKRVNRIEAMGGSVSYLMLDGALRRTISNGVHKVPHAAFLTIGVAAVSNALTYRARVAGAQGNSITVAYIVGTAGSPLSVSVSGTSITVRLATDSAGRSTSTAANVKAAVEASLPAAALVSVSHHGGSNGSGLVPTRSLAPLAYGDNGLNMTVAESAAELVSYIRTVNAARPGIRFVLVEDVILWPYDGVAGYASLAYPRAQRPDFKIVWAEVVRQLRDAGLLRTLVGMHNDVPVEYLDGLVPSINRNADNWYGRVFKQQAQVQASGVRFGQHFNSLYGGSPQASDLASPSYFQSQVLHHVRQIEQYRLANRPDLSQMGHFTVDTFMYEPRIVTPWTNDLSTDSTYLKALALFKSYSTQAQTAAATAPLGVISQNATLGRSEQPMANFAVATAAMYERHRARLAA